MSNSYSLIGIS